MKLVAFVTVALTSSTLLACDSLVTTQDRGDAVLNLKGQALSESTPMDTAYEVGVLFARAVVSPIRPDRDPEPWTLETEIVKGTISGTFPAQFQVDLAAPSQAYSYDVSFQYGASYGVFDPDRSPAGVRIGHLVVGPAAELDNLPSSIAFDPAVRSQGEILAPYLANTTVTGYQVIYAEGVGSDDKIYPLEQGDGTTSGGQNINEGYTLVDVRIYMRSWLWAFCRNEQSEVARTLPAFAICEAANAGLIGCLNTCPGPQKSACEAACYASFPDQIDSNACNVQVAAPLIDATCGPENLPRVADVGVLDRGASLSVILGVDDLQKGMLITHMSNQGQ